MRYSVCGRGINGYLSAIENERKRYTPQIGYDRGIKRQERERIKRGPMMKTVVKKTPVSGRGSGGNKLVPTTRLRHSIQITAVSSDIQ